MIDTKALRQKVLDLAIRGKLVPQNPNDEPAVVLLERIRKEKQKLVKEGKLKAKDIKNDTVIFKGEDNLHYEKFVDGSVKCIEGEIPFELPEGWAWTRLGVAFSTVTGSTPSTKDSSLYGNDYPFYKPTDLDAGFEVYHSEDSVSERGYLSGRSLPDKSVLVTCIGATIGKTGYIRNTGICNQQINAILPIEEGSSEYIYFCMCSEFEQRQIWTNSSATTLPILNKSKFENLLLPIPPKGQQMAIVSEIKELLSFVEIIRKEKSTLQETIKTAKSKILDLAIRGQLVPQNSNDEPAAVLLERIRLEKEELIKQGKIKRDKKESIIFKGEDNSYYQQTGTLVENLDVWDLEDIPDTWEVCCLGDLCDYGNCLNVDTKTIADDAWILDLEDIEKDSGRVIQKIRKFERESSSTKHLFRKGQVLYSKLRPYLNKVVLADEDGFCTSEILPLNFSAIVEPQYALYYLMSPTFLKYANRCSYGVKMPRLGTADGKKAVFPLPPFKEQQQIVQYISNTFAMIDTITNALT